MKTSVGQGYIFGVKPAIHDYAPRLLSAVKSSYLLITLCFFIFRKRQTFPTEYRQVLQFGAGQCEFFCLQNIKINLGIVRARPVLAHFPCRFRDIKINLGIVRGSPEAP